MICRIIRDFTLRVKLPRVLALILVGVIVLQASTVTFAGKTLNTVTYAGRESVTLVELAEKTGSRRAWVAEKKKGVLIPSVHIGEMYHILSFLARQHITIDGKRKKVGVVVIASPENEFFFQELLKSYDNVFVPVTGAFDVISQEIEYHLQQNRCVMIMHDYFKKHQYRVPFIYGSKSYDFLIPVPRLLTVLHLKLGSPIIPSLSFLRKNLKYSKVVFFPPIDPHKVDFKKIPPALHKDLEEYKAGTLEEAKKHALLSLLINRRLYPFVLKYPFLWR